MSKRCPHCEDKKHWHPAHLAPQLGWVHSSTDPYEYGWAPCQLREPAPPAPPVAPPCWHKEINEEGICKDCGKRAAIRLPFRRDQSGRLLRVSDEIAAQPEAKEADQARMTAPPAAPAVDLVKQARLYGEGFIFPETRGEYEEDLVDFAEQVTAVLRTELACAESELEKVKAGRDRLQAVLINLINRIRKLPKRFPTKLEWPEVKDAEAALSGKGSKS